MNIESMNLPEIPSAGLSMGLTLVTGFAVRRLAGFVDKINPINRLIKFFENTNNEYAKIYNENSAELKVVDKEISDLKRMKTNQ